jgi:hypothetical protein
MSWRRFIKRRWWDEERAREIDAYLEIETADNVARGMPPAKRPPRRAASLAIPDWCERRSTV